jgi:hypothetical protein
LNIPYRCRGVAGKIIYKCCYIIIFSINHLYMVYLHYPLIHGIIGSNVIHYSPILWPVTFLFLPLLAPLVASLPRLLWQLALSLWHLDWGILHQLVVNHRIIRGCLPSNWCRISQPSTVWSSEMELMGYAHPSPIEFM